MPDVADLRLLGEIVNHGAIGLPQAAWNAGMSQSEAAARLIVMAERGMPLRLVAEGDQQQLWYIAQAGPAAPAPPAFAPPPTNPPASINPPPPTNTPAPTGPPTGPPAATTGPVPTVGPDPTVTREPTERPDPTGTPDRAVTSDPTRPDNAGTPGPADRPDTGPAAVWGVPGTADWVRPTDEPAASSEPADTGAEQAEPTEPTGSRGQADTGTPPVPAEPTRRVLTSGQPVQPVVGLFGEQLDVGLQQILDPADDILKAVGYRLDDAERALLVQTSVGNRGPVAYESLADLYLEVIDASGTVLGKAAMAVAGYPAHVVGVPANTLASGWTVFLVPARAEVAQVRWSVRPDLPDRTVSWGFGPAPTGPADQD